MAERVGLKGVASKARPLLPVALLDGQSLHGSPVVDAQLGGQRTDRVSHGRRRQVAVVPLHHPSIQMAELRGHKRKRHPVVHQAGSVRMPQFVKRERREAGGLAGLLHAPGRF